MNEKELQSKLVYFALDTGLSPDVDSTKRYLSAMQGMYNDVESYESMVRDNNVMVYEFYELGLPEKDSDIAFGTSITYPGKVGAEYFMTKGHFHTKIETAEAYYCLRGHGYMMMENPEGAWEAREMKPGLAVYVPPRYAHRSINVSPTEPLVTFYAFRADAGHDYGSIETHGFRKLIVERAGQPEIIDNPRWQS